MKKIYATKKDARRAFYLRHRERLLKSAKDWRAINSDKVKQRNRRVQWKRHYGLTEAGFKALWNLQGGLCAICQDELTLGLRTHVDHDHETGRVRGLLCGNCNGGLGLFRDDPRRLVEAVRYLNANTEV